MIPKSGNRFSEKIMLKQRRKPASTLAGTRIAPKHAVRFVHISRLRPRSCRRDRSGTAALVRVVMFALFERLLKPTEIARDPEPPAGLVAFYWHFARQAKAAVRRAVRRRLHRRAARHDDPGLHRPRRHAGHRRAARRRCSPSTGRCCSAWRWCCWCCARWRDHRAEPARQPGDRRQCRRTASAGRTTGTWCGSAGRSSRTTSPAASPTA